MAEKITLDPRVSTALNTNALNPDLRTVNKLNSGNILLKLTGIWNNANLLHIGTREYVQPSVSDLRMVVRIQRRNKHPHSTKKHK